MKIARALAASVVVGWTAALLVLSCASDTSLDVATPSGGDAGREDTRADADATVADAAAKPEASACSAIEGPCDIVSQDCEDDAKGAKRECVVARDENGALTTQCIAVQASQQLPIGRGCCPGADNPCLPGLSCIGEPCVDGGAVTGRCSPACCAGDDVACGQSDPEGIGGQCDLTLFVGSSEVHQACTYRERCKPFGVEPCKAGQTCILEDKVGTAGCLASNGIANRQPCQFANDCRDGYICAGPAGGGICRMLCLTPNSNPTFDASAADGAAGKGGCPTGESCTGPGIGGLPDWVQLCELPDGG